MLTENDYRQLRSLLSRENITHEDLSNMLESMRAPRGVMRLCQRYETRIDGAGNLSDAIESNGASVSTT